MSLYVLSKVATAEAGAVSEGGRVSSEDSMGWKKVSARGAEGSSGNSDLKRGDRSSPKASGRLGSWKLSGELEVVGAADTAASDGCC